MSSPLASLELLFLPYLVLEPEEQLGTLQLLIYLLPPCNCDTLHRLLQFKAFIQQIIAAVKALYRCRQQHCRKAEAHQLLYQAKASAIFHKQSPCL